MAFAPFDADLDRVRERLTDLLLRAPRRPDQPLWQDAIGVLPDVESWAKESPIAGVATTVRDGEPAAVLFLADEYPIDTDRIRRVLNLPIRVETLVTGPFIAAARPTTGGESISGDGPGGDTGTLGCLVQNDAGDLLILGCNHTLAGVNQSAVNADTVRQPGIDDGGTLSDTLGILVDYETIVLGGYHKNKMDAAVAEAQSSSDVTAGAGGVSIQGVGLPLSYYDRVQKVGWKSGHTFGSYEYLLSCPVAFPRVPGATALFVDQYGIVGDDPTIGFARGGDSGAVVLTESSDELVGIVIGVTKRNNVALASPIDAVLAAFAVSPVQ